MAAFLNSLKEEGTKDDCLAMCAKLFDETVEQARELTRLREANASLRADLEKAKEALRPFAKAADELIPTAPDNAGVMWDGIVALANAGHLRTAARTLSELENSK
jgi:hypothetical protein